jgi:hypothetical protein
MTCRVARFFPRHPQLEPLHCSRCASPMDEVLASSCPLGPHLCGTCVRITNAYSSSLEGAAQEPTRRALAA